MKSKRVKGVEKALAEMHSTCMPLYVVPHSCTAADPVSHAFPAPRATGINPSLSSFLFFLPDFPPSGAEELGVAGANGTLLSWASSPPGAGGGEGGRVEKRKKRQPRAARVLTAFLGCRSARILQRVSSHSRGRGRGEERENGMGSFAGGSPEDGDCRARCACPVAGVGLGDSGGRPPASSQLSPISFGSPGDKAFPKQPPRWPVKPLSWAAEKFLLQWLQTRLALTPGLQGEHAQQNPTPCPGPQTSTETNGAGISTNRIIRSVSLHTFTYLSGYSGPLFKVGGKSIEMDQTTALWQHLHGGGVGEALATAAKGALTIFFFFLNTHTHTTPFTPKGPLLP